MSGMSPLPWIGDQTYHFDVPTGARKARTDKHRSAAQNAAEAGNVDKALDEIGTALHPLQDAWSHKRSHRAETPKEHAPWYHCVPLLGFILDPVWCLTAASSHPNWSDHTRPDQTSLWPDDAASAVLKTLSELAQLAKYRCVKCRCEIP